MRVGVEVGGVHRPGRGRGWAHRSDQGAQHAAKPRYRCHQRRRKRRVAAWRVDDFVHGSTVATNALLERKGAKVAFVVTRASGISCIFSVTTGSISTTCAISARCRWSSAATASRSPNASTPRAGSSRAFDVVGPAAADPAASGRRVSGGRDLPSVVPCQPGA